jgi:hypothetical protein
MQNHAEQPGMQLTSGFWLSIPAAIVMIGVWFSDAGLDLLAPSKLTVYILIAVGALSLPWSLLAAFPLGLILSGLPLSNLDTVHLLYGAFCTATMLGCHLNGFLLFARRPESTAPTSPLPASR